jgi:D-alanyl-D-alanine carboxypeptidase
VNAEFQDAEESVPPTRRIALAFALAAVTAVGALAWLSWQALLPQPQLANPNAELQRIVSEFVANDPSIKNCVVSVMRGDGSLAWSGAAGMAGDARLAPMTGDTPIYIASVTKLYTATVIMILNDMHMLSIDEPVARYLPEPLIGKIDVYDGRDYSNKITIRELLAQRSGLADYDTDKSSDGKSLFDLFLAAPTRRWTVDDTIARTRQLASKYPPGTATSYSDTNFQLLGKVIEAVTGKPLDVVYADLIFRPLGLDHSWLVGHPPTQQVAIAPADVYLNDRNISEIRANGSYWADGGIVSTADEMNAFLKALKEGRLVRPDTLATMHKWRNWRFPLQYGYGTMYLALPRPLAALTGLPPLWGHSGSTGSFLYYAKKLDLYLAGSIDQAGSTIKPFMLMREIISVAAR